MFALKLCVFISRRVPVKNGWISKHFSYLIQTFSAFCTPSGSLRVEISAESTSPGSSHPDDKASSLMLSLFVPKNEELFMYAVTSAFDIETNWIACVGNVGNRWKRNFQGKTRDDWEWNFKKIKLSSISRSIFEIFDRRHTWVTNHSH